MTGDTDPRPHWLDRPETPRRLATGAGGLLGLLVAVDLLMTGHPYFAVQAAPAFPAWFGLAAVAASVAAAVAVRTLLCRAPGVYDD